MFDWKFFNFNDFKLCQIIWYDIFLQPSHFLEKQSLRTIARNNPLSGANEIA